MGLCLLLATALSIRGVQEFEGNYSVGASNSLAEFELQNYADSGIYEKIIGKQTFYSDRLGEVTVEVRLYESVSQIRRYERRYENIHFKTVPKDYAVKNENGDDIVEEVTIWLSIASCENKKFCGKMYRRAMAYVKGDGTVCFLTNL